MPASFAAPRHAAPRTPGPTSATTFTPVHCPPHGPRHHVTHVTHQTDQTDVGVVEGMQIVRACSTKVTLLPGQDEMVIDLRRMSDPESGAPQDPMARFSGDWENEFVPDYKKNLGKGEDAEDEGPSFGSAGVAPWDMVW